VNGAVLGVDGLDAGLYPVFRLGHFECIYDGGLACRGFAHDHGSVSCVHGFLEVDGLGNDVVGLGLAVLHVAFVIAFEHHDDLVFDGREVGPGDVHVGEQPLDQTLEEFLVFEGEAGSVHVTQGLHDDAEFVSLLVLSFQLTCHDQGGLQSSKTEVVVHLFGELFFTEFVEFGHFACKPTSILETFGHKFDFADQVNVGHNHCHWSEKGF